LENDNISKKKLEAFRKVQKEEKSEGHWGRETKKEERGIKQWGGVFAYF